MKYDYHSTTHINVTSEINIKTSDCYFLRNDHLYTVAFFSPVKCLQCWIQNPLTLAEPYEWTDHFNISKVTGEICLLKPLDREIQDNFKLFIRFVHVFFFFKITSNYTAGLHSVAKWKSPFTYNFYYSLIWKGISITRKCTL